MEGCVVWNVCEGVWSWVQRLIACVTEWVNRIWQEENYTWGIVFLELWAAPLLDGWIVATRTTSSLILKSKLKSVLSLLRIGEKFLALSVHASQSFSKRSVCTVKLQCSSDECTMSEMPIIKHIIAEQFSSINSYTRLISITGLWSKWVIEPVLNHGSYLYIGILINSLRTL